MALHLLHSQAMLRPAVILTAGNTPSPGTGGVDASRLALYAGLFTGCERGYHRLQRYDVSLMVIWTVLRNFTGMPFSVAGLKRHCLVAASTIAS
jgi:hypothetical protein